MSLLSNFEQHQQQRDEEKQITTNLLHIATNRLTLSEDNHAIKWSFRRKESFVTYSSHCRVIKPSQKCVMSVKKWFMCVIIITLLIFIGIITLAWLLNRENHYLEDYDVDNESNEVESGLLYVRPTFNLTQQPTTIVPLLALSQRQPIHQTHNSLPSEIKHDWQVCKLNKLKTNNNSDDKIIDYVSDDNRVKIVLSGRILIYNGENNLIGFVPLNEIESISTQQLDSIMPKISIKFTCGTIDVHIVQLNKPIALPSIKIVTNERQYFIQPIGGEVSYQQNNALDDYTGEPIKTIKWSDVARHNFKFRDNSHFYCDKHWKSMTSKSKRKYDYAELQLSFLEYEINRSPETDFNKFETARGGIC